MPTAKVKDEILGECEFNIPDGWRFVPVAEFARRRKKAVKSENWNGLDKVRLWDGDTNKFLPISSAPYRWRVFVEQIS